MTSIALKVIGAQAQALVTGPLTSGMVGIPVTIEYDETWEGLTKNLICRCSVRDTDSREQRAILNVGSTAVVAHEVMQADTHLYLGLEGFSPDGSLVIPTTWAMCGFICQGANTGEDLSAAPTLPVWDQLQARIDRIESGGLTLEQLAEAAADSEAAARGHAKTAADAAADALESAGQAYTASQQSNKYAYEAREAQTAAEKAAERAELRSSGLSSEAAGLLITILRNMIPYSPQTANIDALAVLLAAGSTAPPEQGVTENGSVLTIISGVTVEEDGDTLIIK